jgi:hypothetical protein
VKKFIQSVPFSKVRPILNSLHEKAGLSDADICKAIGLSATALFPARKAGKLRLTNYLALEHFSEQTLRGSAPRRNQDTGNVTIDAEDLPTLLAALLAVGGENRGSQTGKAALKLAGKVATHLASAE